MSETAGVTSAPSTGADRFYVTGGTLRHDAPSYVERQADRDLYEGLSRGEFCYILTARQMGKSSLMARTAHRLRQDGVTVVVLDLTAVGQNLSPDQWYDGLRDLLGMQLGLEDPLDDFWEEQSHLGPLQRWMKALQEVVLARIPGRIVIFLEEIDTVQSLPFSTDEFFAGIRECYNRRTRDPAFERLTFCLLGVASPTDLIRDTRLTPFNVGRRIELTDFTEAEAAPLAGGLLTSPPAPAPPAGDPYVGSPKARAETTPRNGEGRNQDQAPPPRVGEGAGGRGQPCRLLERVLYWTNGHPYLTQRLCQAVSQDPSVIDPGGVDRLCEAMFLSPRARERDDNLLFVRERLLASEAKRASLLDLYARVRRGKRVRDEETSELVDMLRLSGMVRASGGYLRVRNRIYERVFDREWVIANMPDAELRRQRIAYRRGLGRATIVSGLVLFLMGVLVRAVDRQAQRANRVAQAERLQRRRAEEHIYAAHMQLARQAWDAGNVGHAVELLEQHRPQPGQEDLRGFEWRYLWRLCQGDSLFTFRIPGRGIRQVAFSPDGKTLATSSVLLTRPDAPAEITLWDVVSRRQVATLRGLARRTTPPVFSPDGRTLAIGGSDGTVRLWDVAQQHELPALKGDKGSVDVDNVAFSPDGQTLASGSHNGTVTLWSLRSRREAATFEQKADVNSVVFSPNGKTLAVGDEDGIVRLWDVTSKREVAALEPHSGEVNSVVYSPDGKILAIVTYDSQVKLWDPRTGQELANLPGHKGDVLSAAFSPDGRVLATGSQDATVRLWDVATRRARSTLKGHRSPIRSVAFAPGGRTLATASDDGTAKLWNVAPKGEADLLTGHRWAATSVAFSPDGKLLATGSWDRTVRLWDVATGRKVATLKGHKVYVWCVAFSPDGKILASGGAPKGFWVHPDRPGEVNLWSVATRSGVAALPTHQGAILCLAFSHDGRRLATGSTDNALKLWSVATGKLIATLTGKSQVSGVAFSSDDRTLAIGHWGTPLTLWDVAARREAVGPVGDRAGNASVALAPNGRLLAFSDQSNVTLWDIASRRQVTTLKGHTSGVEAVAFSPEGNTLASASDDCTIKLWNLAIKQEVATLTGHTSKVMSLAFSPDGNTLASASYDATIRLWRAAPLAEADAAAPHRTSLR